MCIYIEITAIMAEKISLKFALLNLSKETNTVL